MAVDSPCTQVCTLDAESGWCLGCLRSIDEVAAWGALDDAGKQRVLAALPARRATLPALDVAHEQRPAT